MPTTVVEEYVTRREAAELARVHLNTIRLWESTGRIHTTKGEGGVVLIPRHEIEAIIESRRDSDMTDAARIAALETEVRLLREERDRAIEETDHMRSMTRDLIDRITSLARGREEGQQE